MTAHEFRAARECLDLTQIKLAETWGLTPNGARSIRRWETGELPVNKVAAYCIRLMVALQ